MLRKKVGLGQELVVNGDFATDSVWDKRGAGTTINSGECHFNWGSSAYILLQNAVTTIGVTYKLAYEITSYTSGSIQAYNNTGQLVPHSEVGSFTEVFEATSTSISWRSISSFVGSIDNVSIKEVL